MHYTKRVYGTNEYDDNISSRRTKATHLKHQKYKLIKSCQLRITKDSLCVDTHSEALCLNLSIVSTVDVSLS